MIAQAHKPDDADGDLEALASVAEAQANAPDARAGALATPARGPRYRVFLRQSRGDRIRGFCWAAVRATLFRMSPVSAIGWRNFLLRVFGAKIAPGAAIAPTVRIECPWNLVVGARVVVCDYVIINCMGAVTIGDRTRISQYSHMCAGTHEYQRPDMRIEPRPIALGADVWIAADAFVGPGVRVGDGALLAARSSAFHDLPPGMICVGEPAKPVKERG